MLFKLRGFVILSSLLFSCSGEYNFLGINISCQYDNSDAIIEASPYLDRFIFVLSLGPIHTFVHELGHALCYKMHNIESEVEINLKRRSACTWCLEDLNPISETIVNLSGPLLHIAFCIAHIYTAFAFQAVLTPPIALVIAGFGARWYISEISYAISSALDSDNGDFGRIRDNGLLHLVVAATAMIGISVLGIYAIKAVI